MRAITSYLALKTSGVEELKNFRRYLIWVSKNIPLKLWKTFEATDLFSFNPIQTGGGGFWGPTKL